MLFCINKENKPATCCCGCSLMCGIITLAVLLTLSIIGTLAKGYIAGILGNVIEVVPIYLMLIWQDNKFLRLVNMIIQGSLLALIIVGLVLFGIAIEFFDVPKYVCGGFLNDIEGFEDLKIDVTTEDDCEHHARKWLYIGLVVATFVLIPLQYLWFSIFKAHYDELDDSES